MSPHAHGVRAKNETLAVFFSNMFVYDLGGVALFFGIFLAN